MIGPVDVSVCIAQYNHIDLLERCLDSLSASAGAVSHEVIVVDNKSADDSVARLRRRPGITLIENDTNVGYAGAINAALARATGRYCLVLNNDTAVFPDTLAVLTEYMDRHPRVGAATCALYPSPDAPAPVSCTYDTFPSATRVALENLATLTGLAWALRRTPLAALLWGTPARLDCELRVSQILGAFMFVRAETIRAVGPMDPGYFLYLEETDWCFRMRQAGWELAYTPATRAVHLGSRSTSLLADRAEIYRTSMTRFLTKHRGRLSALAYRLEVLLIERPLTPVFLWLRRLAGRAESP